MHASNRFARGFTLLEVLAALVIVSLGMLGVIEAVGQTASNATRIRDRTIAHWVAMNRLTEARVQARAPSIGKSSGEIEMAGRDWRWTMEVSETPVQTMRRIDVRVGEAENEDDERTLATITGFFGSAVAPAGMVVASWTGSPTPGAPGSPGPEAPPQGEPGGGDDREQRNDDTPPPGESAEPPQQNDDTGDSE